MPIVIMSPTVKLTEGPDFAFGARWALVQYHPWNKREHFLNMDDQTVKECFRTWRAGPDCPWYIVDQYFNENGRRARCGAGPLGKTGKADRVDTNWAAPKLSGHQVIRASRVPR